MLTTNVVATTVVDLLDAAIPESQLPHPVDATSDTCRQTQVRVRGSCVEPVGGKVVVAMVTEHNNDEH
jgi:hypothetical protein